MRKNSRRHALEDKESQGTRSSSNHRERILQAALVILTKHGRDALTTRAVAEAAKVKPPILYRLFQDKTALLEAVAEYGFQSYLAKKRLPESDEDAVESLRIGWKMHIEFALDHSELYRLMYADPHPKSESQANQRSYSILVSRMRRVARTGRLRVSEERAAHLFHAAAFGIAMTLLAMPIEERDMSLSAAACESALRSITTEETLTSAFDVASAASTLHSLLQNTESKIPANRALLTEAERSLLMEWLQRLADSAVRLA